MNLPKTLIVMASMGLAMSAFAQDPKSSDAGPGGTAGGQTTHSDTGINTGNLGSSSIGTTTNMTRGDTSGEGPGTTPDGRSTNKYRAGSTAGMDRTTSTSNTVKSKDYQQSAQKKRTHKKKHKAASTSDSVNQ